jgi:hypothetical protein
MMVCQEMTARKQLRSIVDASIRLEPVEPGRASLSSHLSGPATLFFLRVVAMVPAGNKGGA